MCLSSNFLLSIHLAHPWSRMNNIFTKLWWFPRTFTARLAPNPLSPLWGELMSMVFREIILQHESVLSVTAGYLGSLPSPAWKIIFHSFCSCCCCCFVFSFSSGDPRQKWICTSLEKKKESKNVLPVPTR